MSGGQHPDLDLFYDLEDQGDEWGDEDEDGDYEFYDAEEIEDEDMEGDENDDLIEEGDEGEEDEDMGQATLVAESNIVVAPGDEEDETSTTFLNLAALLNQSGGNADARTSLLARLLAGPASGTRQGAGMLRRLAAGGAAPVSDEERRRAADERRRKDRWWVPQTEPHPRGLELLKSGEFGRVGDWRAPGKRVRPRVVRPRRRGWVPPAAEVNPLDLSLWQTKSYEISGNHSQHSWDGCRLLP